MIKRAVFGTVAAGAVISAGLPAAPPAAPAAYAPPAGVHVADARAHSFRFAWDRVAGAWGYLAHNSSGAVIRSFLTRRERAGLRHVRAGGWYVVRPRTDRHGSPAAPARPRTSSHRRVHASPRVHASRRAHASRRTHASRRAHARWAMPRRADAIGARIAAYARTLPGHASYVWGGTGPHGFDCSGLALYVYNRFGYHLPRTAQAQFLGVRHVRRSSARPGDLVFFLSGGYAYHVGIYEGGNTMVAAATPASGVQYQQIYSSDVAFGTKRRH